MPTRYSGDETRERRGDASPRSWASPLQVVPIDEAFERELEAARADARAGEALTPITRAEHPGAPARRSACGTGPTRAAALFLQTGNMSEKAVGYTTIGGDLEGALAVIANVPKTVVMYLLDYLLETTRLRGHPPDAGEAAPGPELADDQEGEEELMPFPVLDACFYLYAGEKLAPDEVARGAARDVPRDRARRGSTAGRTSSRGSSPSRSTSGCSRRSSLHVGNLDLDRERALQLPVVQRNEWGRRGGE